MFRKTLIIITILPAAYFWSITAILGMSQPFFASLVVGGLLGFIGLIRAGWGFGGNSPGGRIITQVFLGVGLISAISGIVFLSGEVFKAGSDPAPIGIVAIASLLAISIVGVLELIGIWRQSNKESATSTAKQK